MKSEQTSAFGSDERLTRPQVFELGHLNRATACTNLNEHSSRSHALLIITVSGLNSTTGTRTQGVDHRMFLTAGGSDVAFSGRRGPADWTLWF